MRSPVNGVLARAVVAAGLALVVVSTTSGSVAVGDSHWARRQYRVLFTGGVEAVSGLTVRVGESVVHAVRPQQALRRWPDSLGEYDVGLDRVHVGDVVDVAGWLQTDGSVLAYQLLRAEEGTTVDDSEGVTNGLCSAVTDRTITVAGRTFTILNADGQDDPADVTLLDDAWYSGGGTIVYGERDSELETNFDIRAGDAVSVTWVRAADGHSVAAWATVRQSGDGTVLAGTVTGDDGLDQLLVDGVYVVIDELSDVRGPWDAAEHDYEWIDIADLPALAGRWAHVDGVLRNGKIYANLVQLSAPASDAAKRGGGRRRTGWMRMLGMATSVESGEIAVNGLAAKFGRGDRAAHRLLGHRVRVDARLLPTGIVATAVRSR